MIPALSRMEACPLADEIHSEKPCRTVDEMRTENGTLVGLGKKAQVLVAIPCWS
jgi:hypothetical protein